jgi:hypothetical protein
MKKLEYANNYKVLNVRKKAAQPGINTNSKSKIWQAGPSSFPGQPMLIFLPVKFVEK